VVSDRLLILAGYLKKFREIEEVKGDFVSMLVHDMRSPLTSILGFTDVLAEGMLGKVTEEQAGALQNIKNGCDRLLMLIEDVLDLSKLEAGKMQIYPSPLQVGKFMERACTDLAPLFMDKDLRVVLDLPEEIPYVLADGRQLSRVLTNLLTNAAKFTPAGGQIVLSAACPAVCPTRHLQSCLQISVADTGPGIPAEQQQKLFGRYQQLPAGAMFRKGTGLGLAICKEIVHLHNGEIWVESPISSEGGSRFSFTLPLAE
jgi:signal transduction histidine kinase